MKLRTISIILLAMILSISATSCGGGGGGGGGGGSSGPKPADSGADTVTLSGQVVDGLDGVVTVLVDGNAATMTGNTWTYEAPLTGKFRTVMVECYVDGVLFAAQDLDIDQ